jgi:hypothetical protein
MISTTYDPVKKFRLESAAGAALSELGYAGAFRLRDKAILCAAAGQCPNTVSGPRWRLLSCRGMQPASGA